MAKIVIQDLAKGTKLDKEMLKKISGGTTFRINAETDESKIVRRTVECYDTNNDGWISWEEYQAYKAYAAAK